MQRFLIPGASFPAILGGIEDPGIVGPSHMGNRNGIQWRSMAPGGPGQMQIGHAVGQHPPKQHRCHRTALPQSNSCRYRLCCPTGMFEGHSGAPCFAQVRRLRRFWHLPSSHRSEDGDVQDRIVDSCEVDLGQMGLSSPFGSFAQQQPYYLHQFRALHRFSWNPCVLGTEWCRRFPARQSSIETRAWH